MLRNTGIPGREHNGVSIVKWEEEEDEGGGDMREANAMSTTAAGWRRAGGRFLVDGLLDAASP